MSKLKLSVIVIACNMARQLPSTIRWLSAATPEAVAAVKLSAEHLLK
jgi:hypothetical protein